MVELSLTRLDSDKEKDNNVKKKYTIGQIMDAGSALGFRGGSAYFLAVGGGLLATGLIFFATALISTGMTIFGQLYYGTALLLPVWGVTTVIWRIRDIIAYLER